ncbi:MAG: hypothetical protein P1Q69_11435 [Candidatus Thorarchaeota archaeon]|nr:hypothetical protein [Candidatus Thorarchaeota archaeon]
MEDITKENNAADNEVFVANQILEQLRSDINQFFEETENEEIRKIYVWCGGASSLIGMVRLPLGSRPASFLPSVLRSHSIQWV